jgi:hypothetical protein
MRYLSDFSRFSRFFERFLSKMADFSGELRALHARIEAGELTKQQAAALMGVSYAHFCVRLSRAGLIDSVRTERRRAQYDSPAMTAALAEALASPPKHGALVALARKHGIPDDHYTAFAMRVSRIRRSRAKADLCHANSESAPPG